MGQIFSPLRSARDAANDAPIPSASVAFPEHDAQCDSRKPLHRRILTLPREKEFSQCFSRLISKPVRSSQKLSVEPVRKTLLDLPTEILLNITQYLPPSSLVSFDLYLSERPPSVPSTPRSRVVQRSDYPLTVSLMKLEDICKSQSTFFSNVASASHTDFHLSERLELLCMLDRDGRISPSEAICSGCAETHDSSLFSASSLARPNTERRCLGSAGFLWVCPHRILNYDQAQRLEEAEKSHPCGYDTVYVLPRYDTCWRIMNVTNKRTPSNDEVKEALRPLNAPICPHLRLNDAYVASWYIEDCRNLRWMMSDQQIPDPDCRCSGCSPKPRARLYLLYNGGECESCGTHFYFAIKPEAIGKETLCLRVCRKIEGFRDCTDRAWVNQVADPADFGEYERAWQATTAECERKVGSIFCGIEMSYLSQYR